MRTLHYIDCGCLIFMNLADGSIGYGCATINGGSWPTVYSMGHYVA